MKNFREYLKNIRARGQYAFTTEKALSDLGISRNAFNCGMYKLKKKGEVISPARYLYVIVPPEHQGNGCLPAEELLPILMKHWNLPYYVCLLSAAYYHGASHQKPQAFQVMTHKQLKPIICGKVKIEFVYRRSLDQLPLQQRTVKTGYLSISTPELTVMDMFTYPHRSGGLNHIATVLSELVEVIQPEALKIVMINSSEKSWIQRFGYVLEHVDSMDTEHQNKVIRVIQCYVDSLSLSPIPLAAELSKKGAIKNPHWQVFENTSIESDL